MPGSPEASAGLPEVLFWAAVPVEAAPSGHPDSDPYRPGSDPDYLDSADPDYLDSAGSDSYRPGSVDPGSVGSGSAAQPARSRASSTIDTSLFTCYTPFVALV